MRRGLEVGVGHKADVLFFTVASGPYEIFALPYAIGVLSSNFDAAVEIVLDDVSAFKGKYGAGLQALERSFPERQLHLREDSFEFGAPKARFLLTPEITTEYVYIGDVDVLMLDGDVARMHFARMNKWQLPWSNQERKNRFRLTGLHFTRHDAHYPLPDLGPMVKRRLPDEELLYEIVRIKGGFQRTMTAARPVHGIHMSPNRTQILPAVDAVHWGATEAYWRAYKALKHSRAWKAAAPHFAPEYQVLLASLERVCVAHYEPEEHFLDRLA
jgi:hypothetical protein